MTTFVTSDEFILILLGVRGVWKMTSERLFLLKFYICFTE